MKILLVHQFFLGEKDPGGSRFNQFVHYWSKLGHEITVVAGTVHYATGKKDNKYRGRWITKETLNDRVTVYRCYVSESYNKSFLGRMWAYFSFTVSSLWTCIFHIKKHDVIIVSSPPLFVSVTGMVTSLLKRLPMIFEVRDLWPESAIDTGVLKNTLLIKAAYLVEKITYRFAEKINVLTPAFRDVLINKKNVAADKILFIPNGADLDIFKQGPKENWVREKYGLKGKFIITYLGAHGVANHLVFLLKVAEHCRDYPDIVFMLVGDGMEKSKLQAYAKEHNLTNVLFIDPQPKSKIPDFCNATDVGTAVLMKIDTFKTVYPNKLFDYMSSGIPVIIGIDGVARKLVEDSQCGYYADPENVEDFKAKILKLYHDEKLRTKMGRNGLEYVKAHFSRESLAYTYAKELEKIIEK